MVKKSILVVILSLSTAYSEKIEQAKMGAVSKAATSVTVADTYAFSSDSKIEFKGSKLLGSHDGGFEKFSGAFKVRKGIPVSGSFTIDMASLWSDNEKLTGHLKGSDFFDVEEYKESSFVVTSFHKNSETNYSVSGNLTIVGKTQNITFSANVEKVRDTVSLSSVFKIDRQDWGVSFTGVKDNFIKDDVVLRLSLKAKKTK